MSSFGVNETMQNLESGAVKTLLIYDDLKLLKHVLVKKNEKEEVQQQHEEQESTNDENLQNEEDQLLQFDNNSNNNDAYSKKILYLAPNVDPNKKGWQVISSEPLIDYLTTNANKFGVNIELISDSTAAGSQFCRGFGGIGALLRFAVKMNKFDFDDDDVENRVQKDSKLEMDENQNKQEDNDDDLAEYFD